MQVTHLSRDKKERWRRFKSETKKGKGQRREKRDSREQDDGQVHRVLPIFPEVALQTEH
jgi:hypothetical protein